MWASISLIRVSTTGFRGKKYWSPQSTFLNTQEARGAALGGYLAQLRQPCCAVFTVLLHSHVTFRVTGFSAGCAGTEDNPQPRCTQAQQIRDLTWTEICTELWYFPPTLYQHEDDRDQKQVSRHWEACNWDIQWNWPRTNPDLTYSYCFSPSRGRLRLKPSCQPARPGG